MKTLRLISLTAALFASTSALADICQHELPATDAYKEAVYFYPCDASAPLPATTLSGGYSNTYRNLQWMAETLAENGYVVLALTPINIYGDVPQWTAAHLAGQQQLVNDSTDSSSPLLGKIDIDRRGIAGFSMGGGGTLVAGSQLGNNVKAIAAFAPFLKEEDRAKAQPSAPTMILAGDSDLLVTNESIVEIENNVIATGVPNLVAVYRNGRHQQWYRPEIQTNRDSFRDMTLAWFNRYLKGDSGTEAFLQSAGSDTERFSRYRLDLK